MFCIKCGKQIPDVSRFCTYCGAPINSVTPIAQPASQPVAAPVAQPAPEPVAVPVAQPVPEPVAAPVAQPAPEPVAEPVAQPVTEVASETIYDDEATVGFAPEMPAMQPQMAETPAEAYMPTEIPNAYKAPQQPIQPQPDMSFGGTPEGFVPPPPFPGGYGMYGEMPVKDKPNFLGILIALAVSVLSVMAFLKPLSGMFGFAFEMLKTTEYKWIAPIVSAIIGFFIGDEFGVSFGFINGIATLVAAIVGFISMIIFITYIVCELKGKNRPTRARVALIMCLIVTVFQVVSIFGTNIGMKEMYADVIGMEVDELRVEDFQTDSTLDTGEIFGSLDIDEGTEIDDEDVYEVFGIDPDDIEDDEDAVEAGKKMLSKLYIPGIYQYIIIAVSILGIILIRKKKN